MSLHDKLTERHAGSIAIIKQHFDGIAEVEDTGGGCHAIMADFYVYDVLFVDGILSGLSTGDDDPHRNTTWLACVGLEGDTLASYECADLDSLCRYISGMSSAECVALEGQSGTPEAFEVVTVPRRGIHVDEVVAYLSRDRRVRECAVIGTGGGCLAVEAILVDGRHILLTDGDLDVEFTGTVTASVHTPAVEIDDDEGQVWVEIQSERIGLPDIRAAVRLVLDKHARG